MKDSWLGRGIALLLGGVCGSYLPAGSGWLVAGIFVLCGARLVLWRPRDFFGHKLRPELLLLAASLMLGCGYGALAERLLPGPLSQDGIEIVGRVKDWNLNKEKAVGIIRIDEGELAGESYQLSVYPTSAGRISAEWMRIQPGDFVSFRANLERPQPLGTQGGFDRRLYYGVRGLSGTLIAKGDVVLLAVGKPSLAWKIRQQVRSSLQMFDSEDTGVLEGILFGDTSQIPNQVLERYKVTGVLHVFAASGSNVAFVLGLSWMMFVFAPKSLRIGGTILVLILYAALCGGNAPILRATIMGIAFLLGRWGKGTVASLRWLFFAGVGLFIYNPLSIRDIGFQLSFAAAWGIVVLTPHMLKRQLLQAIPEFLRLAVAGTIAAQVATLPLMIAAFHRLSLVGFLANVFILFILGSVLEVGIIGVVLTFFGTLAVPFFQVSLWLLDGANRILKVLADLPYADVWVLNPGLLFWLAWYGGIVILLRGKQKVFFRLKVKLLFLRRVLENVVAKSLKRSPVEIRQRVREGLERQRFPGIFRNKMFLQIIAMLLLVICLWSPWNLPRDLVVTMIDVGQGDSILLQTPGKQNVLIDAGPRSERFDAGERIVIPYLLSIGIRHLDGVLITHEHQDHIGGVQAVLNNIPTDWVGIADVGERLKNEEWQEGLPEELLNSVSELRLLHAGDRLELDSEAWLDVVGPPEILEGTHSDANNNSLVLKLNYLGQRVMLTADMEQEEMESIVERGVDLETDVFKEPHHGSRFSLFRPWLERIHPQAILISVGKNSFGHPSQEILDFWEERHIPVYRTDEKGTIRLLLGEKGLKIIPGR